MTAYSGVASAGSEEERVLEVEFGWGDFVRNKSSPGRVIGVGGICDVVSQVLRCDCF